MKVCIAIDSFKGSLSSREAGEAAARGIRKIYPDADISICPIADGGEGTVDALIYGERGKRIELTVTGPLGESTDAYYGILNGRDIAVIEMATAAGLPLVPEEKRDPLYTTTYGVGEIILDAVHRGCRDFIIGIGGSATNDGGVGMLSALGFEFLDAKGRDIPMGAIGLRDLDQIKTDKVLPELSECTFNITCDVKNPLCGENGCSRIFAPQKGATPESVRDMDVWLERYADITKTVFEHSDKSFPGAGAAGGLGFAFLSYLGGTLCSGIDLVMTHTGIEDTVKDSDLIITGEGRLDGQSYMGKVPIGVARIAKKYGKTVVAFCGAATDDAHKSNAYGIDAFFPILRAPCSLAEAMDVKNASRNLELTSQQVASLYKTLVSVDKTYKL